jgi:hypothetical protein
MIWVVITCVIALCREAGAGAKLAKSKFGVLPAPAVK